MGLPSPDLVLTNGHVITLDSLQPSAKTVLIGAGRILSVNNEDLSREQAAGIKVVDCRGHTVLPGFIDAHCHLRAYVQSLVTLNLEPHNGVRSIEAIRKKIHDYSQSLPPGTWIRGRGYDEFHLAEGRHPTRWDLDRAAGNHPVIISHRSGRAHVLNSLALSLVSISQATPDPPDGLIERDVSTGEPVGLLYSMSKFLSARIPPLADDEYVKGIKKANANLLACGITSLHDASARNGRKEWRMFEHWRQEGLVRPRIRMMLGLEGLRACQKGEFSTSEPGDELAVGGIKIIVDETTGRLLPDQTQLNEIITEIHCKGLQAVIHAVEENAIESACLAVETALKAYPRRDHRHRIEHCSVCPPALARRLAAARVMVVTQPCFIFYSGNRYIKTVPPEQFVHLYPLATLLNSGVPVAGSSDFPVAPPTPLAGIYAAMTRRAQTEEILLKREALTAEQALRLYTRNGAWSAFEEKTKGTITPGKLADLVVLDGDPTTGGEAAKDIRVMMTFINGKEVWNREVSY